MRCMQVHHFAEPCADECCLVSVQKPDSPALHCPAVLSDGIRRRASGGTARRCRGDSEMTTMKYRVNRRAALGLIGGSTASLLIPVPGARVSAQTLDKLSFQTNWRAQAEHGGYYLAAANGIYKKYGIETEIRPGGPQQNPSQLLLGGRVDMSMSTSF